MLPQYSQKMYQPWLWLKYNARKWKLRKLHFSQINLMTLLFSFHATIISFRIQNWPHIIQFRIQYTTLSDKLSHLSHLTAHIPSNNVTFIVGWMSCRKNLSLYFQCIFICYNSSSLYIWHVFGKFWTWVV